MSRFPNLKRYLRVGILSLAIGGGATAGKFTCNYLKQKPTPDISTRSSHLSKEQRVKIRKIELKIRSLKTWVLHDKDMSKKRIEVSKLYMVLARMDDSNRDFYLGYALSEIDGADRISDSTTRYHRRAMYVRDYFEVLMQIGSVHFAMRNYDKAITIYKRTRGELKDKGMLLAQQVHDYSVPGYRNRTNLELAQVFLRQKRFGEAKPLLAEVRTWAAGETSRSGVVRWYVDVKLKDLHYLEAKSSIGLGIVAITEGNYRSAFADFKTVLSKPEAGDEAGFMDLGFDALTYSLWASIKSSPNIKTAKAKFKGALPWSTINRYGDLKKALDCRGVDLASPNTDLFEIILRGLGKVRLNMDAKATLRQVQITYQTGQK